jgi:hypothetical protein
MSYEKKIWLFIIGALVVAALAMSLKVYAKYDLCRTYYSEMSRLTCFISDSTLPQRTNR